MAPTFRLEAIEILQQSNKSLTSRDIVEQIIKRSNLRIKGKNQKATMQGIIMREIEKKKDKSAFIKMDNGFALNPEYKE